MQNVSGPLVALVALDKAYAAKIGGGTVANINEVNLLDAGAIAIFTESNRLITASTVAADIADTKQFVIYQGNSNATLGARRSPLIDRNSFHYAVVAPQSPVKQVTTIGLSGGTGALNFPATLVNGTFATIVVTDTTAGRHEAGQIKRYSVPVYATDDYAAVVARLVAEINADPARIVTAAAVGTPADDAITLTAVNNGTKFTAGGDDVLYGSKIAVTTDPFDGVGQADEIRRLLIESNIRFGDEYRGNSYRDTYEGVGFWNYSNISTGSLAFLQYIFQWTVEGRAAHKVIQTNIDTLILAVDNAATTLKTALATIFGVIRLAPEAGSGSAATPDYSDNSTVAEIPSGGEG